MREHRAGVASAASQRRQTQSPTLKTVQSSNGMEMHLNPNAREEGLSIFNKESFRKPVLGGWKRRTTSSWEYEENFSGMGGL